ncbi:MAG: 4'-phosphopantetheinyl transferase family protein [Thermoleophilaceae bacterium]
MAGSTKKRPLASGEVHVWLADVDAAAGRGAEPEDLSREEWARSARLRFDVDRGRFVARRALLRRLLGDYLGVAPEEVVLESEERGKPRVVSPDRTASLELSLSASGGLCVYAFAPGRAVGVDLELVRADLDVMSVARRALPRERADLLEALPPRLRPAAFFADWVDVEARVKLSGEGLAGLDPTHGEDRCTTVTALSVPNGYVAALALDGPPAAIIERRWPEDALGWDSVAARWPGRDSAR